MVGLQTNASEIVAKYERRYESLRRMSVKPMVFATALHNLRKANLQKMVYNRTPYKGTKSAPKGKLLAGERLVADSVFNIADHATRRVNMKGYYKDFPGLSKEANWPRESFVQVIPVVMRQERAMNMTVLRGG